jgi:hypothetical protein
MIITYCPSPKFFLIRSFENLLFPLQVAETGFFHSAGPVGEKVSIQVLNLEIHGKLASVF